MEFMLGCVAVDPRKRQTIRQLQQHPFIKMAQEEGKLDTAAMEDTNVTGSGTSQGANLYKFQIASVINQVVYRKKSLNASKMKRVESIVEEFNISATGEDQVMLNRKQSGFDEPKLQFGQIEALVAKKLDPFETKRLVERMQLSKDVQLTYDDTLKAFD